LGLFLLQISLLFYFISSLLLSFFLDNISFCEEANKNDDDDDDNDDSNNNKEWSCYFFNLIFSQYFRHSANLHQESGGSMASRVLNEGTAEIGNTFS
jgi:hypothetical protein